MVRSVDKINTSANSEVLQSTITGYSQYQWHNYNFAQPPGKHSLHSLDT